MLSNGETGQLCRHVEGSAVSDRLLDAQIELSRDQLCRRLRDLRKQSGQTLAVLSQRTGFAVSTLSKMENGAISISFDGLIKLATALGVSVADLFQSDMGAATARRSIARLGDGATYETPAYRYRFLCTDLAHKRMVPIHTRLKAGSLAEFGPLTRHPGEEFLYVLSGRVAVHTEFYSPVLLGPGESIYFDSTMGHALVRAGDDEAELIWVCTDAEPPTPGETAEPADPSR
jgi:transcriptional regulator with XRE-family HTH domain